jgi:hypothetical protein
MGLYLCVFEGDKELDGVEVGSYADFNFFRDAVVSVVEDGQLGSKCPTLVNHPDSDGEWTSDEASQLLDELDVIKEALGKVPPVEFNSPWKKGVAKTMGIVPKSFLDCFFDVDGEPLLDRLRGLAEQSVRKNVPILFQ